MPKNFTQALRVISALSLMTVSTFITHARAAEPAPGYPEKAITIIVPNPAGSATDTLARLVAEALNAAWRQPVVVENKPGAQGIIGVNALKAAKRDGYTLIVSFSGLNSSNPWLYKNLQYHYQNDFTHIAPLVRAPSLLLVNAGSGYRTMADLMDKIRRDPKSVVYGYGQATSQVMGAAFANSVYAGGIEGVPYKGQPPALTDLVGGQYDFIMADLSVSKPFLDAGKVRALGISTKERSSLMPEVSPISMQGLPEFDLAAWVGISGPAAMPPAVVTKLNREITRFMARPETEARIKTLGFSSLSFTPQEFKAFVESEHANWGKAIRAAAMEPQ